MSKRVTDTYPAQAWRNISDNPQPIRYGELPAPADGMWFVSCDYCGTLGNGISGLYGNPSTANTVAERHNLEHEEG